MAVRDEPEILMGLRAFAKAQQLLAGDVVRTLAGTVEVGWHGTEADGLQGAFAVVQSGAGLDDLIGEVLRVSYRGRAVYVYVGAAVAVPTPLSLARRAFFPQLAPLSAESRPCTVEVVG
jgi:hypothetical protein